MGNGESALIGDDNEGGGIADTITDAVCAPTESFIPPQKSKEWLEDLRKAPGMTITDVVFSDSSSTYEYVDCVVDGVKFKFRDYSWSSSSLSVYFTSHEISHKETFRNAMNVTRKFLPLSRIHMTVSLESGDGSSLTSIIEKFKGSIADDVSISILVFLKSQNGGVVNLSKHLNYSKEADGVWQVFGTFSNIVENAEDIFTITDRQKISYYVSLDGDVKEVPSGRFLQLLSNEDSVTIECSRAGHYGKYRMQVQDDLKNVVDLTGPTSVSKIKFSCSGKDLPKIIRPPQSYWEDQNVLVLSPHTTPHSHHISGGGDTEGGDISGGASAGGDAEVSSAGGWSTIAGMPENVRNENIRKMTDHISAIQEKERKVKSSKFSIEDFHIDRETLSIRFTFCGKIHAKADLMWDSIIIFGTPTYIFNYRREIEKLLRYLRCAASFCISVSPRHLVKRGKPHSSIERALVCSVVKYSPTTLILEGGKREWDRVLVDLSFLPYSLVIRYDPKARPKIKGPKAPYFDNTKYIDEHKKEEIVNKKIFEDKIEIPTKKRVFSKKPSSRKASTKKASTKK